MISVSDSGSFDNIEKWLKKVSQINPETTLRGTAQRVVNQLTDATPRDSGVTAGSWGYKIVRISRGTELSITNNSFGDQTYSIIQGLRYGHGTGTGGYVAPNDFVSPVVEDLLNGYIKVFVRDVIK